MFDSIRYAAEVLGLDLYPTVVARGLRQLVREQLHRRGRLQTRSQYSHREEETIIRDLVQRTQTRSRFCLDIGASDGVSWSNSLQLFREGWSGVAVELNPNRFARLSIAYRRLGDVSLVRCAVTPENVVTLLELFRTPRDFGVLSLDIDSFDYDVLDAILGTFRPAVICTEYNEKIPPPVKFAVRWDPTFRYPGGDFYGHSLTSLTELASRHDYALVAVEFGNAFLTPKEAEIPPVTPEVAYQAGYVQRPERRRLFGYNPEAVLTMSPPDVVRYFSRQFAPYQGRFDCSVE